MSPRRYYAAASSRCIHCKGTHASEDHHLSVSIPSLPNTGHTVLSPPQEQNNSSEPNTDALDEYKITRKPLPSQQSAYLASQWTPHPHQNSLPRQALPPLLTQSASSTDVNDLRRSTAYSQTITATRYIPGSMPPRTSHQLLPRPMAMPANKSSNNLGTNTAASRHSRGLSTRSTRGMRTSFTTTTTQNSKVERCGTPIPGHDTHVQSHHRRKSYNPRREFGDDHTQDIGDIFGEEAYNNID